MDRMEQKIFNDISDTFKLLKANWNALKSNPSCEKDINTCLTAINNFIQNMKAHQDLKIMYKNNQKAKGVK